MPEVRIFDPSGSVLPYSRRGRSAPCPDVLQTHGLDVTHLQRMTASPDRKPSKPDLMCCPKVQELRIHSRHYILQIVILI